MTPLSIFWFRRDLRFEDNCGLYNALQGSQPVLPLFIFDRAILDKLEDKNDARINFIHDTISTMDSQLRKRGSGILVRYGYPEDVFRDLFNQYNIAAVYTNHDYEPYAIERDTQIRTLLEKQSIPFYTFKDQVIFEKKDILNLQGKPYTVYTPFRKRWQQRLTTADLSPFPSESLLDHLFTDSIDSIPDLKAIGFKKSSIEVPAAHVDEEIIQDYDKTRNFPALSGTSRLGVHLRFGTMSIRRLVRLALELNETWLGELIWREFFMMILYHFPHVVDRSFREKYDGIQWRNDKTEFKRWCQGETGYPLVDAGLRELTHTGYMHNRVRMVAASFLTKHLLIDWRWGERFFARHLLDFELASNNGNWQWAAGCGCDAAPYFRIFNPTTQIEKFDKDHIYIKRWVPEWQTDKYVQPIVDHKFARERALSIYATAVK